MSLDSASVFNAIFSHAAASGLFERVNTHEPKNAPGHGLTAAIWVDRIDPVRASGLASTSARVTLMLRIFQNMLSEPADAIDPNMTAATDTLMGALQGDFELGGVSRMIDVFASSGGFGLQAKAGYITQDQRLFRVMDLTIPVIINDAWTQEA